VYDSGGRRRLSSSDEIGAGYAERRKLRRRWRCPYHNHSLPPSRPSLCGDFSVRPFVCLHACELRRNYDRKVAGISAGRIEAGAVDAAALDPFKKYRPMHGHGRENEKSLLGFGCDFSGWYDFGKAIKTVATGCHILKLEMHRIRFRLGLRRRPRCGSLQRSPTPP